MRKQLFAANWKMHDTADESAALVRSLLASSMDTVSETLLFPSMTSLPAVTAACRDSPLLVGAQNMHWLEEGAYTGETSPTMLLALHCTHVLIGHSERRRYFNETDDTVNLKLKSALAHGLIPVVCVGETKGERDAGRAREVLERQVSGALRDVDPTTAAGLVFAYEPLWAVGSSVPASTSIVQEVHQQIRALIAEVLGPTIAEQTRILYGGSVDPNNARSLCVLDDVDGALVGRAGLDAKSFVEIVRNAHVGSGRATPSPASASG